MTIDIEVIYPECTTHAQRRLDKLDEIEERCGLSRLDLVDLLEQFKEDELEQQHHRRLRYILKYIKDAETAIEYYTTDIIDIYDKHPSDRSYQCSDGFVVTGLMQARSFLKDWHRHNDIAIESDAIEAMIAAYWRSRGHAPKPVRNTCQCCDGYGCDNCRSLGYTVDQ